MFQTQSQPLRNKNLSRSANDGWLCFTQISLALYERHDMREPSSKHAFYFVMCTIAFSGMQKTKNKASLLYMRSVVALVLNRTCFQIMQSAMNNKAS